MRSFLILILLVSATALTASANCVAVLREAGITLPSLNMSPEILKSVQVDLLSKALHELEASAYGHSDIHYKAFEEYSSQFKRELRARVDELSQQFTANWHEFGAKYPRWWDKRIFNEEAEDYYSSRIQPLQDEIDALERLEKTTDALEKKFHGTGIAN